MTRYTETRPKQRPPVPETLLENTKTARSARP
jgi:hypothetical protein